jgi:hypothetical protein
MLKSDYCKLQANTRIIVKIAKVNQCQFRIERFFKDPQNVGVPETFGCIIWIIVGVSESKSD